MRTFIYIYLFFFKYNKRKINLLSGRIHFGCVEQVDATLIGECNDFLGCFVGYLRAKCDPCAQAELRDTQTCLPEIPYHKQNYYLTKF